MTEVSGRPSGCVTVAQSAVKTWIQLCIDEALAKFAKDLSS